MRLRANEPFLSAVTMRRAFNARLLSLAPTGKDVLRVEPERIGGFEDRSYKLRYIANVRYPRGPRKLILRGSLEKNDDTRRQAYEIMKYLWRNAFDHGPLQIARPVTFFQRWKLLVYEEAPGEPLSALAARHPKTAGKSLVQAAQWLAKLHQLRPRQLSKAFSHRDRARYWRQALSVLQRSSSKELSDLRATVKRVLKFEDRLARLPGGRLVHHDFHPGNIIVDRNTMRVVDFTESRISHPLVDVGSFLAQLDYQMSAQVPPIALAEWKKVFLRAYHRSAPRVTVKGMSEEKIFQFMRFRIALQTYIGLYLVGQHEGPFKRVVERSVW